MKVIVMEQTMEFLFPVDNEGSYIIPDDFEVKSTSDGVNYIIREEK